jgi:hypothetical protein
MLGSSIVRVEDGGDRHEDIIGTSVAKPLLPAPACPA